MIGREEEEERSNKGKVEANVRNLEGLGSGRKEGDHMSFCILDPPKTSCWNSKINWLLPSLDSSSARLKSTQYIFIEDLIRAKLCAWY